MRFASAAAALRQPLLDRVEPAADRAQLGLELLDVVVGRGPAALDRACARGERLGAAGRPPRSARVERALRASRCALAPRRGRLDGSLDRVSELLRLSGSAPSAVSQSVLACRLSTTSAPIHLQPAADLAERVLLPGDPHRALAVAQALLEQRRRCSITTAGCGATRASPRDGEPLTVQATGMGGPSAAIVIEELIALGATTLVRIGTCGALDPELELGDLLAAEAVLPADGTSAALGADGALEPDPELLGGLVDAGARPVTVVSSDLFYDPRADATASWVERGAVAVEMEAATILQVAARRGVAAACVLGVSDVAGSERVAAHEQGRARGAGRPRSARRATRPSGVGDGEPLLRPRHRLATRSEQRREGGDVLGDVVEPLDSIRPSRSSPDAAAPTRSSSRSIASSIPSSRWESERSRRVTRSMSAADGMLSAPIAASCAWTAFSRASNARAIGGVDHGVRDDLLGELAERLLALPRQPVADALALVFLGRRHRAAGYIKPSCFRGIETRQIRPFRQH